MAKRRSNKTKNRQSRVPHAVTRANDLRSALGLKIDRSFVESRRHSPFVTETKTQPQTRRTTYVIQNPAVVPSGKAYVPVNPKRLVHELPPQTLNICASRQARKEVLHAFNQTGKAGQKPQVRTPSSNIHCKG